MTMTTPLGMSKCLLFNTNTAMFQLYHGEKLILNEMMVGSALY